MVKKINLNPQGMSRKSKGLMSCIKFDEGYTGVSSDLVSGEPTATAHYSRDENYYQACFGMVGKQPYYTPSGLLMLDDIYVLTASQSNIMNAKVRIKEAFHSTYEGKTFSELWVESEEKKEWLAKKVLGEIRGPFKAMALGIGYSMGAQKLVTTAFENGSIITLKEAKDFIKLYWATFPRVKRLSDMLAYQFEKKGFLVNEFGYRMTPDSSHKAFNSFIQSTITGIVNAISAKFFNGIDYAEYILPVHDEVIFQVKNGWVGDAKGRWDDCLSSLNQELNWSVKIRTGWAEGLTWFDAH
jgi:hypothetical protein